MVALETVVAGSILISAASELVEEALTEYQPKWLKEAEKVKKVLAFSQLPCVCHYTLSPLLLTNLIDDRTGVIRSVFSLGWRGTYHKWLLSGAYAFGAFSTLALTTYVATFFIFPQVYRYLGTSPLFTPESLTGDDFAKELPQDHKDLPVSIGFKLVKDPKSPAQLYSFNALQAGLIAALLPQQRLIPWVSLVCLIVLLFKEVKKPPAPAIIELSFSWDGKPLGTLEKWHSTTEKYNVTWKKRFQLNEQGQYLCLKGHLIAEDKRRLMESIEKKRQTLLNGSKANVTKTHYYVNGRYSYTKYKSSLKLPEKNNLICSQCEKPSQKLKECIDFTCHGQDRRVPWHINPNPPRLPYKAPADSITAITNPKKDKK